MDDIQEPEFFSIYFLLVESESGDVQPLKSDNGNGGHGMLVAQEGNQQELIEIGDGMLQRKLIIGYQLSKTVRAPVKSY